MNIRDMVSNIDTIDKELIICAKRPWSEHSDCTLTSLDENLKIPKVILDPGYEYVIEVGLFKDELIGLLINNIKDSLENRIKLLIHYGENDAYPEWIYEKQ